MGWPFTSLVTLGLPSWLFDFSIWLILEFSNYIHGSWTSTLHYISYILKLYDPQMTWPMMTWHFDKTWQGIDDMDCMRICQCQAILSAAIFVSFEIWNIFFFFLLYMAWRYGFFNMILIFSYCHNMVSLCPWLINLYLKLQRCLLVGYPSSSPSLSSYHNMI